MKISATKLVKNITKLLKKGGVGSIRIRTKRNPYIDKFEVRVPLQTSKDFLYLICSVAQCLSMPCPQISGFLHADTPNGSAGPIEAAYLYNKDNIIRMMNLMEAAFHGGRPDGFIANALERCTWVYRS